MFAGLVDDNRVAASRARILADRGFGNRAIDTRLESEGFDRERRERAVSSLEPEQQRAHSAISAQDREAPARAAARLARRGFDDDAIEAALARLDGIPRWELP